jgi:hypothetical protein
VELAAGRWDEAARLAQLGLELALQIGVRLEASRLAVCLGEALIAAGRPGATAQFEAALQQAVEAGAPGLEAIALFGLACASPHHPEAETRVSRARELLKAARDALAQPVQSAFVAVSQHTRVLFHCHHFHSVPLRPAIRRNLMPEGFLHRGFRPQADTP